MSKEKREIGEIWKETKDKKVYYMVQFPHAGVPFNRRIDAINWSKTVVQLPKRFEVKQI